MTLFFIEKTYSIEGVMGSAFIALLILHCTDYHAREKRVGFRFPEFQCLLVWSPVLSFLTSSVLLCYCSPRPSTWPKISHIHRETVGQSHTACLHMHRITWKPCVCIDMLHGAAKSYSKGVKLKFFVGRISSMVQLKGLVVSEVHYIQSAGSGSVLCTECRVRGSPTYKVQG